MAETPKPADTFGDELENSIKSTEALLNGLRYDLAQKVLDAGNGIGEMPSPFEVAAIKKLEIQLENDRMFAQARALTRKRSEA